MSANKKYAVSYKISNVLGIIAGVFWTYIGFKKVFVDNWANILIVLIEVSMIVLNFSLLKDNYFR